MKLDFNLSLEKVSQQLPRFWELSGQKIRSIETTFDTAKGAPVFTENGTYVTRGWTEWTQGFQFGSAVLQFDATGDAEFLEIGRKNTLAKMAPHLTHIGVHDHGFNNVSTYGNLLRLILEGKIEENNWEKEFYKLALKVTGAVQATRWTSIQGGGFIYSFNGPHSLFVDTIRSCRALVVSHQLGHVLQAENDRRISLIQRAIQHLLSTVRYSIFYGKGRDSYDISGRTAHEIIFNTNDGNYRCPNSQQGYTGFSTWTRGLAWAICGLGETLEIIDKLQESDYEQVISKKDLIEELSQAAQATAEFYLANMPLDGIPYSEPYLSTKASHQGLILHSIYHQPNGWDYVPEKGKVAHGESSMWGDYHARELALLIQRMAKNEPYYSYLNCVPS